MEESKAEKEFEESEKRFSEELKEDEQKDTKKLVITILVIIGLFIAFFAVAYVVRQNHKTPPPETHEYNNFEFVKEAGLWRTNWQLGNNLYTLRMHFGPWELENVSVEGKFDERFHQKKIYLTFDPEGEDLNYVAISAGELSLNLYRAIQKNPIAACTYNATEACIDREIITCNNTNSSVIYLKSDPEAKVILNGNCLTIQGPKVDILRGSERVLYQWYQIMR